VKVESLSNAKAVSAGLYHSCAVLHDGRAFCWGNNQVGQLGNRSTINSSVPVEVALP
jgi:alpha-tubulin suppressor-like RCC1 family protein